MIPNPWVILGIVLTWLASLVAVGIWQNKTGHTDERVTWQTKENKELAQAAQQIKTLNEAARATEQQHAEEIKKLGEQHAKDQAANEAQRRKDVAAARDGALKLRFSGACPVRPDAGRTPEAPASPAGSNDAQTIELPPKITADLYDLVADADAVAIQLAACQSVITSDRRSP